MVALCSKLVYPTFEMSFHLGKNVENEYVLLGNCNFYQRQLFESPNNLDNLVKFLNII